ncbi:hypothetical protein BJX62DRAFT_221042 [Aspergillus germanicus]
MISAGPTCHAKSPPLRLARRLSGHICRVRPARRLLPLEMKLKNRLYQLRRPQTWWGENNAPGALRQQFVLPEPGQQPLPLAQQPLHGQDPDLYLVQLQQQLLYNLQDAYDLARNPQWRVVHFTNPLLIAAIKILAVRKMKSQRSRAMRLKRREIQGSSYLPRLLVNHQPLVVWLWTFQISALVILRNCRNTPTKLLVHITTRGRTIRRPSMLYRSLARGVII